MNNIQLSRYQIKQIKDNKRLYGIIANGYDNLYPDYLNGLYNNSVTHQSVINDLVGYVMGEGLKADNAVDQQKLDKFFPKKKLRNILTLKEVQQSITLEAIKSVSGQIVELNPLNPAQIRVSAVEDGEPVSFLYRKSWDRYDTTNYRISQEFENINNTELYEGLFYWYDPGTFPVYYGRPRYMGGMNAIELEIAIYMMHNHGAQNGMFPSMIMAKPSSGDPEQDREDTKETQKQLVGPANAGKLITTYFPQGASAPVFTTPNLTGLDKIYENQYAVAESGILKAHSVPSPLLISGLNQKSSGLGSLDEELEWAKEEMMTKLVEPKRSEFLDIISPLLKLIGINGEVRFEDSEEQVKRVDPQTEQMLINAFGLSREQCAVWLATDDEELTELQSEVALGEFISLGEKEEEMLDYDLILTDRLEGEPVELDLNDTVKLATVPSSSWQKESEQDTPLFKVRYRYGGSPRGERDFCRKVVNAGKVYRKEDITQLDTQRVNPGFGPNGSDTYNIWFFKGGPNCQHFWERRIYMRRDNRPLSVNEARRIITDLPIEERIENRIPENARDVARRPEDMPNNGYLNPRLSAIEKLKEMSNGSK